MGCVTVEFSNDGCALITMKNGENRFNPTFLKQVNDAMDKVERNEGCRMLITTGEGKFYSNGLDLEWLMQNPGKSKKFMSSVMDTLWRVMHFPIPTVAAINGHAFAGGGFLAICHDYRVMNCDRGWITWNETLIGLPLGDHLAEILHTKLDSRAIRESTVFARRIAGHEAKQLRIIDETVPGNNVISEAKRYGHLALGKNIIKRNSLKVMKENMYPRKVQFSKL